jgi:hypothetical protein
VALISFWRDRPDEIRKLDLRQILAWAGDGNLLDESECSVELRAFLSEVEAEELERYVAECLEPSVGRKGRKGRRFDDSGFVLQDVVNEIGRRLDFTVTNGIYQGRPRLTGFDGIWRDGSGTDLVIEVKTTDTYSIPLDTVDGYRRDLIESGIIAEGSSVLFVVGRDDTGALEAQIRGSRHAWTMRMIGAASLVRLLQVKVNAESPIVVDRIRSIVRPIEYTRVDRIVDLMFEVRADTDEPTPEPAISDIMRSHDIQGIPSTPLLSSPLIAGIETLRQTAADTVSELLGSRLTRRRRSSFETADDAVRAVISVSKRYHREYQSYWYAFYDTQRAYLTEATSGYLILCAADTGRVWAVPGSVIEPLAARMNSTTRPDGQTYWHVLTKLVGDDCVLLVADQELSLTPYEAVR